MWQRFTERARRVVFFAQEEAGRLGENYVSTEHLLLGLRCARMIVLRRGSWIEWVFRLAAFEARSNAR